MLREKPPGRIGRRTARWHGLQQCVQRVRPIRKPSVRVAPVLQQAKVLWGYFEVGHLRMVLWKIKGSDTKDLKLSKIGRNNQSLSSLNSGIVGLR